MAIDKLQDDELVREYLRNHDRLVTLRAPWESLWREIDERVSPFNANTIGVPSGEAGRLSRAGTVKGARNFDTTAVRGLWRFGAAMSAITVPRNTQYIRLRFQDGDLDKLPEVRRWCERTADRLYAIRYAAHAGFAVQANKDHRQLGRYGTSPFATLEWKGVGTVYQAIPLAECYIDENHAGRVDTVHRKRIFDARKLLQEFSYDALTPKMRDAVDARKWEREFEILQIVCPNEDVEPDRFDWKGKPVASTHIAIDEKIILRRAGYYSQPISVSRHMSEAGELYGTSPAMEVLPAIRGANVMKQTILRSAHKMVDPALAFYDDDGITSLVTKPGGLNPGLVDDNGRLMVAPLPTGSNLPIGLEMVNEERADIQAAFLEDFFKILTDPGDRITATQVLEMVSKQGVLVAPFAGQYETEKQNPVTQRDLELAMRAGQVEPFPDVVLEAGAHPLIEYENPLTRMARAEEAAGLTRWIEAMTPLAQTDGGAVFDYIDTDQAAVGLADVLGVRPSWIATPEKVAEKRKAREAQQIAQQGSQQISDIAGAYLDTARANQISQAA
ncbi:portal protein [Sphingomonas sp.]|uniref:portal protein n=1 Tax=Sphingomonas sp. TaxID=28214 RepID=UPI00257C3D8B|nr:portal protein [Sphingomonas sp.]